MSLGARVREQRENRKLSVRKLAAKAKISPSLLSQIENDKLDPSLSSLRKIALALDLPLFYFVLENSSNGARLVKENERRRVVFPGDGLEYQIIHSDLQRKMGIHIGILQSRGATSDVPLAHAGEECLIILEGRLSVEMGNEIIALEPGNSLYFDSSIPHRLYNLAEEPCKFYLIISPPKF